MMYEYFVCTIRVQEWRNPISVSQRSFDNCFIITLRYCIYQKFLCFLIFFFFFFFFFFYIFTFY